MSIYCVYLTVYSGNKLPPFYIGSTSIDNINKGYHGSVRSKKYRSIWEEELNANLHLFKTFIIKEYGDRNIALDAEYKIQKQLRVVESSLYINLSYATKGVFGQSRKGDKHPLYGKPRSSLTREKISKNHKNMVGSENSNAKSITILSPHGESIMCYGNLKNVCADIGLPYSTMCRILHSKIYPSTGACVGYDIFYSD